MKRFSNKAISVLLFLVLVLFSFSSAMAMTLTDIDGHWAEANIQKYLDQGIISGYEDGTFKPNNAITRAEFISIINKYFKLEATTGVYFVDVPDSAWYKTDVQKAVEKGYIVGYSDNTFRPNNYVSRQEAAVVIAKLLKLSTSPVGNEAAKFSDGANVPSWSLPYVNAMLRNGLMSGYPDNTIRYAKNLTRAEVLSMLTTVTNYANSKSISLEPSAPVDNTVEIESIYLTNGTMEIVFDKPARDLELDDFEIIAEVNGWDYTLEDLEYDEDTNTITFEPVPGSATSSKTLEVTLKGDSGKISGSARNSVYIPKGATGDNTAPTVPVITKDPAGNVSVLDPVTITASSTDAEGDDITYVWTGKLADGSTYPLGKQIITCKAVDEHGAESEAAAMVFFVTDESGSGGVLLTTPNSRIYENGIEGATITHFTFTVPYVSGHWGSDSAWVRGLNVNTGEWEYVPGVTGSTWDGWSSYTPISGNPVNINNGVNLEGDLEPGVYSRLEFFYYASHCMYGQSNITYTVDFSFADYPEGAPTEAAPVASTVEIGGSSIVGNVLTGSYTYSDANGDFEGYLDSGYNVIPVSVYQWYRSDDAAGTNKTAITDADDITYTTTSEDIGKYITFEVTPLAVTGVDGTLEGDPAESSALLIVDIP